MQLHISSSQDWRMFPVPVESGIDAILALLHLELHPSALGNWIEQHIQPTGKRNAILIGQGVVEIIS
jgi:hypothetical protein